MRTVTSRWSCSISSSFLLWLNTSLAYPLHIDLFLAFKNVDIVRGLRFLFRAEHQERKGNLYIVPTDQTGLCQTLLLLLHIIPSPTWKIKIPTSGCSHLQYGHPPKKKTNCQHLVCNRPCDWLLDFLTSTAVMGCTTAGRSRLKKSFFPTAIRLPHS